MTLLVGHLPLIAHLSGVMGTHVPITLAVTPGPTINPKRWVGGGAKSPFNAASTPHIAIVWGRTESVRGDEASPQSIVDIS